MKVLSFDQSTKVTGLAIFVDGKYVKSGIIDLSDIPDDVGERSRQMGLAICKEIETHKPDVIIIEEVALQTNVDTLRKLARIQGVAIGFAAAHNIPLHIVAPNRWRSALSFRVGRGVKRQELKKQSINYIQDTYGLKLNEDAAEAVCINEAAHKLFNLCSEDDVWGI